MKWFAALLAMEWAVACAAQTPAGGVGARIEFATRFYDFGRIEAGKVVDCNYSFTNTGDQLLEISDVQSSCGCTTATNWARQIKPGKSGVIPVLFNSGGMAGPVTKNLWVVCNDSNQSPVNLQFSASIWKLIDAIPTVAAFTFGPDFQTNQTRTIRLVSNLEGPVTLSSPSCANSAFKAELKPLVAGKEYALEVTVLPPLGPGSLTAPITVKTSSPKIPEVTVTAFAMVQPALTVMPPRIVLAGGMLEQAERFTVKIQNNGSKSLILSDPAINVKGADVKLNEIQLGRLFTLTVTLPAGFQCVSNQTIEATLKSNHPQSPIVRVPIFQREFSTLD